MRDLDLLVEEVLRHGAGYPRQDDDHPGGMTPVEAATIMLRRYRLGTLPSPTHPLRDEGTV